MQIRISTKTIRNTDTNYTKEKPESQLQQDTTTKHFTTLSKHETGTKYTTIKPR